MYQIITCTGYGTTGSSAVTNIIEEFKDIKSLDSGFECTFLHESDGLHDLENALHEGHRLKTDMAIKRFLRLAHILNKQRDYQKYFNGNFEKHSIDYIDSICAAQWQGNWHRGSDTIKYSKEDLLYFNLAKQVFLNEYSYSKYSLYEPNTWHPSYLIRNKSYYAIFDADFYAKTQTYINKLLAETILHTNARRVLIDQFFPAYDIFSYLNYAPQTNTIIVDRDPRDMYVLNKSSWGESYIPTDNIDTFINWYKSIRFSQKKEQKNNNVLLLHFEDLIFNYETSLIKIKNFLSLIDEDHIKKQKYFNPEKSIKNTYKFNSYPQWKDDVLRIEKELTDYCYHFPNDFNNTCLDKNTPIEFYIQNANKIEIEKRLPQKYEKRILKLLFGMTRLGEVIETLVYRKTLKAKIKGVIKCFIFAPSVLVEYPYLILLFFKINKHSI